MNRKYENHYNFTKTTAKGRSFPIFKLVRVKRVGSNYIDVKGNIYNSKYIFPINQRTKARCKALYMEYINFRRRVNRQQVGYNQKYRESKK